MKFLILPSSSINTNLCSFLILPSWDPSKMSDEAKLALNMF